MDNDDAERQFQLMQRLMRGGRGGGGSGSSASDLAQAMAMLARGLSEGMGAETGSGSGVGIGGGGSRSRVRQQMSAILTNISNEHDDSDQYQGLVELCNQLNMATDETLNAIRPDVFVEPIVKCLSKEYNPELMLIAARSLTYMVDAIPVTILALTQTNGVHVLLDRLRSIVDIELAEQCLTCVEKIAMESPSSILSQGGIGAILGFVDFLNISVQRKAWTTVATLCKRIKAEHCTDPSMMSVFPQIRQCTTHEDPKIAESALVSLARILHCLRRDPERATEIFSDAVIGVADIISRGGGDAVFQAALQASTVAISISPLVASHFIEVGLVGTLVHLLDTTVGGCQSSSETPARLATPPQQTGGSPINALPSSPPSAHMSVTPARNTMGQNLGGSSSGRKKSLSSEDLKLICSALAYLLPKIREGFMTYYGALVTLQQSGHFSAPASEDSSSHQRAMRRSQSEAEASEIPSDDDKKDGEDDEEEAADEEEDEDDAVDLRQSLEQLAAEGTVDIQNDPAKHTRCRVARHSCDACGANKLMQGNWFRCNQCQDFDLCLRCMVEHGEEHVASHPSDGSAANPVHTFTDMTEVTLLTTPATDPVPVVRQALESSPSSPTSTCARTDMLMNAPYLLQRIIEALPHVVRLRLDSESAKVQYYCIVFISRAIYFGFADDLRRVLLDVPLCEAIAVAISDKELTSQMAGVFIAKELMRKLPDIYGPLFIREGITNALLSLKSTASAMDIKRYAQTPMSEMCATSSGWKVVAAREANELLSMFPSLTDATRTAQWDAICTLLQANRYEEAFARINECIADASTFELLNCTLFEDLRTLFQRSPIPVEAVVNFVYALSKGNASSDATPPSSATTTSSSSSNLLASSGISNFTKFIRLLQSALSQLENFKPPHFSQISGVNTQIRLQLMPHNPMQYAAEQVKATGSAKGRGTGSLPSSPVSPSSSETTPSTEGQTAQVSIEPLASMTGVIDFVRNNLLPGSRRPPGGAAAAGGASENSNSGPGAGGNDDYVDEVLPAPSSAGTATAASEESMSRQGSSASSRSRTNRTPLSPSTSGTAIYLRIGRHALLSSMTMLQVVQKYVRTKGHSPNASSSSRDDERLRHLPPELRALLRSGSSEAVTIYYSTVPFAKDVLQPEAFAQRQCAGPNEEVKYLPIGDSAVTEGCTNIRNSIFSKFEFSHAFVSPALQHVLSLLGVFYNTVCSWDCVTMYLQMLNRPILFTAPTTHLLEFINPKLNNKAVRHAATPLLAGQHLSTWSVNLAMDCNYLFTPETRRFLFEVSFFGTARSLVRIQEYMQETGAADTSSDMVRRQHRLQRLKKRVWRDRVLDCATEVLNGKPGTGTCILEFEFYGEEGSGLGPTLEFYTLVGDALRERKHRMWRPNDEPEDAQYYNAPSGLFPRPLTEGNAELERMKKMYRFLGRYIARALLDKRIPNIRLSRPLVKILRGDIVSFDQLRSVNEGLFDVLRQLLQRTCANEGCTQVQVAPNRIEDLGLTFVLPGLDDVELIPNGADTVVGPSNAVQYINLVAEFMLKKGIEPLMMEMRAGFHELVPLYALRVLTVEELQTMLDGYTAAVTLQDLETHCSADHGFTMSCQHVRWLFEIIAEMEISQQRRFFQFLTGSPYLPVGGLAYLRPKLTVVRKTAPDNKVNETEQLPSAMTCQNYLKLPAYESKENMRRKLLQAIEEGCGVFLFT